MAEHDPIPEGLQRTALAWARYKRLMTGMALAAVAAILLALAYLEASGGPVPIHLMIATVAGVGLAALLGIALMGLVYLRHATGEGTDND